MHSAQNQLSDWRARMSRRSHNHHCTRFHSNPHTVFCPRTGQLNSPVNIPLSFSPHSFEKKKKMSSLAYTFLRAFFFLASLSLVGAVMHGVPWATDNSLAPVIADNPLIQWYYRQLFPSNATFRRTAA